MNKLRKIIAYSPITSLRTFILNHVRIHARIYLRLLAWMFISYFEFSFKLSIPETGVLSSVAGRLTFTACSVLPLFVCDWIDENIQNGTWWLNFAIFLPLCALLMVQLLCNGQANHSASAGNEGVRWNGRSNDELETMFTGTDLCVCGILRLCCAPILIGLWSTVPLSSVLCR